MVIISDTSCISALLRVGQLNLLESIFEEIIIPQKVMDELFQLKNFGIDISPLQNADWVIIKNPNNNALLNRLLIQLDEGEANAITLAIELNADLLIIDEIKGRKIASSLSINITGLAGVLILAKKEGYLKSVKPTLDKILNETSFRMSKILYQQILDTASE